MALSARYFTTWAILVQLTTQNTNFSSVCSPDEIEFQNKYCNSSVNNIVTANESYPIELFEKCSHYFDENEEEFSQYRRFLKCEESVNCISDKVTRLCVDIFKDILPPEIYVTELYNQNMKQIQEMAQIVDPIFYTIIGILFVVGIMTNSFLSIILIRHKGARNDMMLVTLVVADILSLVCNMTLLILSKSNYYKHYPDIFSSGMQFFIFVSQYSLVAISFQRFRAVSNKTELGKGNALPNWLKITCLILLGLLYAILHYFIFHILNSFSYDNKLLIILLNLGYKTLEQ